MERSRRRKKKWSWRRIALGLLILLRMVPWGRITLGLLILIGVVLNCMLRVKDWLPVAAGWLRRRGWRELPFELIRIYFELTKFYVGVFVVTGVLAAIVAMPMAVWAAGPLFTAENVDWDALLLLWFAAAVLGLAPVLFALCAVMERRQSEPIKNELLSLGSTTAGYVLAVSFLRLTVRNAPGLLQTWIRGQSPWYITVAISLIALLSVCVMVGGIYCMESAIYRIEKVVRALRVWIKTKKGQIVSAQASAPGQLNGGFRWTTVLHPRKIWRRAVSPSCTQTEVSVS